MLAQHARQLLRILLYKAMDAGNHDVLVIGGGPAGMMAALAAAQSGLSVALLEKNPRVGKKLDITGGGRCNITNAEFDTRAFLAHYGTAEKFLHSPFSQFGVQHTFDFFERLGLPLVVEARKRAFPRSQKASDVTKALAAALTAAGVRMLTGCEVRKLVERDGRIGEVHTSRGSFSAKNIVLATGGASHPETGSSGDAFKWLAELGHTVKAPTPSIVPLRASDAWLKQLAGTTLADVKITFFAEGKRAFAKSGPMLFTHFGLSGPTVLNSAKEVADLLQAGVVTCAIDIFPAWDIGACDKHIRAAIDANKNKQLINVVSDLVPRALANAALMLLRIDTKTKAHSFAKEDRRRLAHLLKALPLTIDGLMGFDRAVVSDGGVILEEIDTRAMRSRLIPNLYVTGDVLHISRPSGGYSLQLCWTSGFVAGTHAAIITASV